MPLKTVAEYLAAQPPAQRRMLRELRVLVKAQAPDAVESLSYGLIGFKLRGKPLVGLGGWASYVSLYALPTDRVPARYIGAKSTIRLPLDEPVPTALVKRLLTARAKGIA